MVIEDVETIRKVSIIFSIQHSFFSTGCTEKFGLIYRRAVSQQQLRNMWSESRQIWNTCRTMMRVKLPKTFRNRSMGLPTGGSFTKKWNFWYFGAWFPSPARCTNWGEILHKQADPRVPARRPCQVSRESLQRVAPLGQKNPWFSNCE